jgi:hypothetical protein
MGDTFVSPFALTDQTKDLNDKFYLILNELVKTFPSSKSSDAAARATYDANMQMMEKLQNDYFLYKNDIIRANETLQENITSANEKINVLENQSKLLKLQLTNLKDSSKSAEGLFDDAQISRNELLISNIILFGIMAGGGYMYYKSLKV